MLVLAWISGGELAVVGLVGLLLFGGKFPEVAKDVGRVLFRLRRAASDLRRESGIDETLRQLEREADSMNREAYLPPKAFQPYPEVPAEPAEPAAPAEPLAPPDAPAAEAPVPRMPPPGLQGAKESA